MQVRDPPELEVHVPVRRLRQRPCLRLRLSGTSASPQPQTNADANPNALTSLALTSLPLAPLSLYPLAISPPSVCTTSCTDGRVHEPNLRGTIACGTAPWRCGPDSTARSSDISTRIDVYLSAYAFPFASVSMVDIDWLRDCALLLR